MEQLNITEKLLSCCKLNKLFITFALQLFMKKEIILILTLIFFGCQNEKNDNSLIDFVPTNPLILLKYESSNNAEKFNNNFNNLINIEID